jgi:hypothetical protein
MGDKLKVLVTVKTYPVPSRGYTELVCTAGIRSDGGFIRLYPINYRYRPYWEWFKKYQWIGVEVDKNPNDPRPESYMPVSGAKIRTLGEPLSTKNNWDERKKIVLVEKIHTMCELEEKPQTECSLGIIRPKEVKDLIIKEVEPKWNPRQQKILDQQELFGPKKKPLEKIPFRFSYKFTCEEPGCRGHKKIITDWEVGRLFLRMRDQHQSENVAVDKVKEKFLDDICHPDRDTHFFVGTVHPRKYKSWIIIGTFYPKKVKITGEELNLPF